MKTTPDLELAPFKPFSVNAFFTPLMFGVALWAFWYLHRHGLPWDDAWQHWFYRPGSVNAQHGPWVWDEHQKRTSFWAHRVPRASFWLLGVLAAWMAYRRPNSRRGWLTLLLALIIIPSAVSGLKHATRHYCPDHLERFGGPMRPDGTVNPAQLDTRAPKPECFPAGHPAPGFALLALVYLARTRRGKMFAVIAAASIGTALTFVQMARGEHFFSHGMASAAVAVMLLPLCGGLARGLMRWAEARPASRWIRTGHDRLDLERRDNAPAQARG